MSKKPDPRLHHRLVLSSGTRVIPRRRLRVVVDKEARPVDVHRISQLTGSGPRVLATAAGDCRSTHVVDLVR